MWIRHTPEEIAQRRQRENGPRQYLIAFAIVFPLLCGYIFIKYHRQIGDHPDSKTIWGGLLFAFVLCLLGLGAAALHQKYGVRTELFFRGSGITVGGRTMLCIACWTVHDARANGVCEQCGGACEDSAHWKWIDDDPDLAGRQPEAT